MYFTLPGEKGFLAVYSVISSPKWGILAKTGYFWVCPKPGFMAKPGLFRRALLESQQFRENVVGHGFSP